jgi:tetratricopeptide (TPR) repeat protein
MLLGAVLFSGYALATLVLYIWSRYDLRNAQQAIQRYDLRAARTLLEASLSKSPLNARSLVLLAQTARRLDDYAEAERRLTDYERRFGPTPGAKPDAQLEWLLLGVQQGDLGGHVGYLQGLVDAEHPASSLILEALAKGFLNVARGSDMLVCLNLLLKREPTNAQALLLRAKGWEGLHQPERALEDFERAVQLLPTSPEGHLGLAESLARQGRNREAMAHYEAVRSQQPSNPTLLLGLARCRFDANELSQTEELLDSLLAGQPHHIAALVERGRLASCQGNAQLAADRLSLAVTLAPWHREALRLLQRCLEAQGETNRAEECQTKLDWIERSDGHAGRLALQYRRSPRDAATRFAVANWALRNGREQEGVRWLFATLDVAPGYGPAHAAVADHFEQTGQPRRCAEHRRLAGKTSSQTASP